MVDVIVWPLLPRVPLFVGESVHVRDYDSGATVVDDDVITIRSRVHVIVILPVWVILVIIPALCLLPTCVWV